MTLSAYQVQFGFAGPIFGAGTPVNLLGIQNGLRELSPVRGGDVSYTMGDGALPGLDFAGARTAHFLWETTLSTAGMETALASLGAQHSIVSDPSLVSVTGADYLLNLANGTNKPVSVMQVQLPGRATPFLLFGRPSKYAAPIDNNYQYGRVQPQSEWSIPDGLIYDGAVLTAFCGLPNPLAGGTFPATFNFAFGASSGGSFQLTNAGNAYAPAVFTITGPCINPTILNNTTGQQVALNITLAVGDTILLDMKGGVVTLNGNANRNNTVVIGSQFFKLAPGVNTIQYATRDSIAVTSQLTGYSLSAYSVA